VDDDLTRTQLLATRVSDAQTVAAQVDLEHRQLLPGQLGERLLTQLFFDALESRTGQNLTLQPLGGRTASARPDREVDPTDLGYRAEALLDDRLAQETGGAGDEDRLAPKSLGYQDD